MLYIVYDQYDENGKRKVKWKSTGIKTDGDLEKAEEIRKEIQRRLDSKDGIVDPDILFHEFIIFWLEQTKDDIDIVTYKGYRSLVNTQIVPYFKKHRVKLVDVTFRTLQDYINEKKERGNLITGKGLSPKTLHMHMNIFKLAFKKARKYKIVTESPCEFVKLPKIKKRKISFYDSDMVNEFFEAVKDERLFPFFFVTLSYGLRRSEALGLKWSSVDFKNNTVTIENTVVTYDGEIFEKDSTKTESSNRTYPLTENIKMLFLSIKEQENRERRICGRDYIENDYIFKWPNGKFYDPDFISKKFNKLLRQNNLPHIRFHDLRHSCASLLLSDGFELFDVKEWLGHSSIQITADLYGHLDIKRKNQVDCSIQNSVNGNHFILNDINGLEAS